MSKGDGVLAKGAQRMLGFFDNPLTKRILNKVPFIGDAIVFLIDLLSGKHWVRALLRTIGAFGVDAGFYALLGLTGIAAPFSAGSSLALSAAIIGAYMAADAAAGAALGSEGVGQFLGDWVADELGVPKKAGESGSGKWESLFGSGGKINNSAGSVKKMIEGVKGTLTDKQKEAISRVGGGLGDPNVLKGKSDDKNKISKEFKMGDKTYDISKLQGGLSQEDYNALSNKDRGILDRRMRAYSNQNAEERHAAIKGNAENIIPLDVNSVAKKTNNISTYDEEEETVVIKSGPALMRSDADSLLNPTKESIAPLVVGGGNGNREIDEAHYKGS